MIYDSIIIGKGPAGISAGLYIKRAGFQVLIIGNTIGALEKSEKINNYYGFAHPIKGAFLAEQGIEQAKNLDIEIKTEEVVNLGMEDYFIVSTNVQSYQTKTILLATGKSRIGLSVPGYQEFKGKGISFCATCDGFFFRDKKLAIIGSGDYAAHEFLDLQSFTKDIRVITQGETRTSSLFPPNTQFIHNKVTEFLGTDKLTAVKTDDGLEHTFDGVFIAIGTAHATDFASKTGILVEKSNIIVDNKFMTNLPGVFAAGDCIGGIFQIAKAVSDGAQSGISIINYLKS